MAEIKAENLEIAQRKLIENARIAMEQGQWDYVVMVTQQILLETPDCLIARRLQFEAYLALFRKHGTWTRRIRALAGVMVLKLRAPAWGPQKTLTGAEKLLALNPQSIPTLKLFAEAARHSHQPELAMFAREVVRTLRPRDQENLIALGAACIAAGRPAQAVQFAAEALRAHPMDGPALELLRQASIAQTVATGNWDSTGTFREKLKG